MARRYELPGFLAGVQTREAYVRWLRRKAQAHILRDRKRWRRNFRITDYVQSVHAAVLASGGRDFYTGEKLDWSLVSRWDNSKGQDGKGTYKRRFALLPTVDHVDPASRTPDFVICAWRTNDCKNDLSYAELRAFCQKLLRHRGPRARPKRR